MLRRNKLLPVMFVMIHMLSHYAMADSIDNAEIEKMREELKEEEKLKAKAKQESNKTTESSKGSSKDNALDPTEKPARQDSAKSSVTSDSNDTNKKSSLCYLAGISFGGAYNATYDGTSAQVFNVGLQGGGMYFIGSNHGIKGYIAIDYNTIGSSSFTSGVVGADYFFQFTNAKLGLFAGLYAGIPFSSNVIANIDVVIDAGTSFTIDSHNRFELRFGYPVSHDSSLERTFVFSLAYQYVF